MSTSSQKGAGVLKSVVREAKSGSPVISGDDLPLQRIYKWEKERAKEAFLTQPIHGEVKEWTWAQAVDEARRMAAWLDAQNWPRGSRIVILSKNCAWWMMAWCSTCC